jgi:general secretion pathway protein G
MKAFTMVELVFVIVILGILAAVAIPRLAASRDDAMLTKGKADISAIRSSIVTKRSQNLLQGNASYPQLTTGAVGLFNGVLDYPVQAVGANQNGWRQLGGEGNENKYIFRTESTDINFEYSNTTGIFTCIGFNGGDNAEKARDLCNKLTQ